MLFKWALLKAEKQSSFCKWTDEFHKIVYMGNLCKRLKATQILKKCFQNFHLKREENRKQLMAGFMSMMLKVKLKRRLAIRGSTFDTRIARICADSFSSAGMSMIDA